MFQLYCLNVWYTKWKLCSVALRGKALFQRGRLRIPCGNGYVTLPETVGIGGIKCWMHAELQG